ncbi:hypothetical protein CRG98_017935 [Punica granatum]|uniref:Uncharacterized protein n=1 Tax=Punica granatum TaxID=22663 RepID=A0A2I0JZG3_PUNGR|nr:hypothetical protein CRG98_017935 [Punica granatum]
MFGYSLLRGSEGERIERLCKVKEGKCLQALSSNDTESFYPNLKQRWDRRGALLPFLVFELDKPAERLVEVDNLHGNRRFHLFYRQFHGGIRGFIAKGVYKFASGNLREECIQEEASLPLLNRLRQLELWDGMDPPMVLRDAAYTPWCTSNWLPHKISESAIPESVIWTPNAKGSFLTRPNLPVETQVEPRKQKAVREVKLLESLLWTRGSLRGLYLRILSVMDIPAFRSRPSPSVRFTVEWKSPQSISSSSMAMSSSSKWLGRILHGLSALKPVLKDINLLDDFKLYICSSFNQTKEFNTLGRVQVCEPLPRSRRKGP